MSADPYLSIVVAARNDDHGGNLLGRMQAFVNALLDQCGEQSLPAELIIVEWNPPAGRTRLADALKWKPGPCEARIIEVPEELHRRYAHAESLPLYQMIAKNAGIRRARGEFVLATNIDILFSNAMMELFAEKRLRKGVLYRVDRHDAEAEVPIGSSVEERLAYCETHRIRVNTRWGPVVLNPDAPRGVLERRTELCLGAGWSSPEFGSLSRWAGDHAEILLPEGIGGTLVLDLEPGPGVAWGPFTLVIEGVDEARIKRRSILTIPITSDRLSFRVEGGGRIAGDDPRVLNFRALRCEVENRQVEGVSVRPVENYLQAFRKRRPAPKDKKILLPTLHIHACGDFTLMAREHWFDLRGYAEFDMYSMNIDALLCWAAHYRGLREQILRDPLRIYHIEHDAGSGWTPEGEEKLFTRLKQARLPWLDFTKLVELVRAMRGSSEAAVLNEESWGLAADDLRETIPT